MPVAQGPKFVQISAAFAQDVSRTRLFALDEDGNVWEYQFQISDPKKQVWEVLADERR
jgi:hypothetical protein